MGYLQKVCFVRVVFTGYIDPESFGEKEDCDISCGMKQTNQLYFLQINRRDEKKKKNCDDQFKEVEVLLF